MNQAAKWPALMTVILVAGAITIVAIIRFTNDDAASKSNDAAQARADSAIIASAARSELDAKVRVQSVERIGDQLWRVALSTPTAKTYCFVLDTSQFRTSKGIPASGFGHVSCAFRK